ncbi:FHA domain-containing protein [Amnibacterium flavum]|uniref:FHA domain-containing protein n=1 Tax=Amnibacterium flavum TaxID=2173173 RepID=A0A2V1HTX6_9MICO|nr:FHA domain-containing protein [Amnibacterium flavum]PVZ96023.1 hypothetical protein DDQ50_06155 [Amnibacterium flavum]
MTASTTARYTPAADGWLAVVSGRRAVLLDGAAADGSVDEILAALDTDDAVGSLLALLLRDGLGAMPAFGFAEVDDRGSRVLVRGGVTARIGAADHLGTDYATWGEHRVEGEAVVFLSIGPAGPSLPLGRGAARARAIELAASGTAPSIGPASTEASAPGVARGADGEVSAPPIPAPTAPPKPAAAAAAAPVVAPPTPLPPAPISPAPASGIPEQTMVEFTLADADPGYSHLFEETIVRPIEHAAVREDEPQAETQAAPEPAAAPPGATGFEEHDGLTIVSGDLARLRAEAPPQPTAPIAAPPSGDLPVVAELRFPSGSVEKLTGPVIIGRSPSSGKVSAGRLPRLVTIPDDPDLSRSHVQVEMQGDTVVVTDLHSRNGTTVVLPGRAPERLRGGVPTTVIHGTVIDLGGGLTIDVHEPRGEAG